MTRFANARNAEMALVRLIYEHFPSANPLFVQRIAHEYFRTLSPAQRRNPLDGHRILNLIIRNANSMVTGSHLLMNLRRLPMTAARRGPRTARRN